MTPETEIPHDVYEAACDAYLRQNHMVSATALEAALRAAEAAWREKLLGEAAVEAVVAGRIAVAVASEMPVGIPYALDPRAYAREALAALDTALAPPQEGGD